MSTLLSDLDSSPGTGGGGGDGDLVNQILREMNTGAGAMGPPAPPPMAPPPPSPASMAVNPGVISAPNSNTGVAQHMMEMNPATAHMINGSHPTPADFAAAMHGGVPMSQNAMVAPPPAPARPYEYPKRSWTKRITEEIKTPVLVSLLVFVFSLPVVNFLFAHYVPRLVLPTGQLNAVGQAVKALSAGAAFWLLQRVIVPLFNM